MVLLKKEDILHLRGVDGKLLSQKVKLETIEGEEKPEIEVLPMTRGEITEIFQGYDKEDKDAADKEISVVEKFCVNPKLTVDEIQEFGKANYIQAIVFAIMSISTGIPQQTFLDKKEKILENTDFLSTGK